LTLQTNRPGAWRRLAATGLLALVDAQSPLVSGSSASSGLIGHARRAFSSQVESPDDSENAENKQQSRALDDQPDRPVL
jgi:hypothetical protein